MKSLLVISQLSPRWLTVLLLSTFLCVHNHEAHAVPITIETVVHDKTPGGVSGKFRYDGHVNFDMLSETETEETWRFLATLVESDDPIVIIVCVAIVILLLSAEDAESIGTLAERTGDTFSGAFTIVDDLLSMHGEFTRSPELISASYEATVFPGFEDISGPFGWSALTVPVGPGTALTQTQIFGSRDFTSRTKLEFDPSVALASEEKSKGRIAECGRAGDQVTCQGEFVITVPEPGPLALLGVGVAGLGVMRRRKAR